MYILGAGNRVMTKGVFSHEESLASLESQKQWPDSPLFSTVWGFSRIPNFSRISRRWIFQKRPVFQRPPFPSFCWLSQDSRFLERARTPSAKGKVLVLTTKVSHWVWGFSVSNLQADLQDAKNEQLRVVEGGCLGRVFCF